MVKKKWTITFILLNLIVCLVHGQNTSPFSVKGILLDSLSNEGEPYATIRVLQKGQKKDPVKLAVTDLDGKFKVEIPKAGHYTIDITSIGKKPISRNFSLTANKPVFDMGKMYISEASEELKGIEVVAQKPLVKADIDKISYSIEDDPDSKTNSTLEMLRKVPLVTVDGEDNIQVNGSSNFKVHVNGKPNTLMSNNPKDVLRSLPANSVKYIEVITDPGAKYDAEGVGGILNIVTTGGRMQGYNVTLGANAGNRGVGGYAYGTVQVGKFTVTGNYSYNYNTSPRSYSTSLREDYTTDKYKFLKSDGSSKNKGNYQFGNIEASYEIDTLNLISFSANIFGGKSKSRGDTYTAMNNVDQKMMYEYWMNSNSEYGFGNTGLNLDYQHSMKKKGEYFTASYKFNNSPNNSESETFYEDIVDVPFRLTDQYYKNKAHTTEHTIQLDYVNPLNKIHYIDAGMKYIFRQNASDSKYFMEGEDGQFIQNEEQSSLFDQGQNILAAYADYQLKWKKLGFKAGARYEHTFMDVEYEYFPERNFDANFNDVVPTVNLSYMLGMASSLKANYNIRIHRPGIWFLNPFRNTSNPNYISYGNPDLDTEKSHNLGFTYSMFSAKFSINASLNYAFTNNGIERYSFMNNGVMESTFDNIGKRQNTRLSLWMNWNPGSKTRISVNASGSYSDFKSEKLDTKNSGFNGNLFGNIQQTLPWDIRFSVYGGGSTPYISLQGKGSSYYYYGFNFSRSFLKEKRLNVSINASNIFNKYQKYDNETVTDTFRSWSESKSPQSSFGFSVSWRFGELKAQVKKANRGIHNDDMKSGGDGSSGGGAASGGNGVK